MTDEIELDYDFLMQDALRGMMQNVLSLVAEIGDAPGEHHFFIEFLTTAIGVEIPDFLLEEYPERMTIVLQHQFELLTVDDQQLAVTLWFKGKQTRLVIPLVAITSFADPSVQFGLRFEPVAKESTSMDDQASEVSSPDAPKPATSDDKTDDAKDVDKDGADIVSLDAFRKK